jgi:hypothetical protein
MSNYTTSSGAFKVVEIYDRHVVKKLKDNAEPTGYNSGSGYESSYYEQVDEMENEYAFAKKYSRFSIIPKVLWFNQDDISLAMERAYKVGEGAYKTGRYKYQVKSILEKVNQKLRVRGVTRKVKNYRVKGMVEFALFHKLPLTNIINDIVEFVMLDEMTELLDDMHMYNYGKKNGHIVAIDLGQVNLEETNPLRQKKTRAKIDNKFRGLNKEQELDLLHVLAAKVEKRKVKFKQFGAIMEFRPLKIELEYGRINVFYGKDNYVTLNGYSKNWELMRR